MRREVCGWSLMFLTNSLNSALCLDCGIGSFDRDFGCCWTLRVNWSEHQSVLETDGEVRVVYIECDSISLSVYRACVA